MHIRDRIKELRRVAVSQLRPHPRNWRTHPPAQHDALRGVLAEIGYAGALLAYELDDGSLQLIDGHLRAEAAPDAVAPVLVLDVDAAEAEKILLTHDPLGAMAGVDDEQLGGLLADVEFEGPAVAAMLEGVARSTEQAAAALARQDPGEVAIPESYQIVVDCDNETQQAALYQRLNQEGYPCRVLTLP